MPPVPQWLAMRDARQPDVGCSTIRGVLARGLAVSPGGHTRRPLARGIAPRHWKCAAREGGAQGSV